MNISHKKMNNMIYEMSEVSKINNSNENRFILTTMGENLLKRFIEYCKSNTEDLTFIRSLRKKIQNFDNGYIIDKIVKILSNIKKYSNISSDTLIEERCRKLLNIFLQFLVESNNTHLLFNSLATNTNKWKAPNTGVEEVD